MLRIRLQKLFLVAVILKVGISALGWYLQRPWSLGFWLPLSVMAAYIVLGFRRKGDDVSDEKFADTCYYLGFIFTITSIIFSLLDLPQIGTRIQEIAVRFGAAMVSTVAGLAVRVYLVSFRKDAVDAVRDAEDALVEASEKFRERLMIAVDRLYEFEGQVGKAAALSVERVNQEVEKLSRDHSTRLNAFFLELTQENQKAFSAALEEVRSASSRLSDSVDGYAQGLRTSLDSLETKVTAFASAVTSRLETTTFPDDFFASRLDEPVRQLETSAKVVAAQVQLMSKEVASSAVSLSAAMKKLQMKATAADTALGTIEQLALAQTTIIEAGGRQVDALDRMQQALVSVQAALDGAGRGLKMAADETEAVRGRLESVVVDSEKTRQLVQNSAGALVTKLDAVTASSESLAERLLENGAASDRSADQLGLAAVSTSRVAIKLGELLELSAKAQETLQKTLQAVHTLEGRSAEFHGMQQATAVAIGGNGTVVGHDIEAIAPVKVANAGDGAGPLTAIPVLGSLTAPLDNSQHVPRLLTPAERGSEPR